MGLSARAGVSLLLFGLLSSGYSLWAMILVVAGCIAVFLTSTWAAAIIVCPRCKVDLSKLLGALSFRPLRVLDEIHVCPFCRLELDAPFDESRD